ncbi:MAG: PTS sugar transporter subunit IIB [Lachnospiraceae bacterium]|jgi:mannose/fructose/N-acetylgalactosamine-specific phosphotransferase system component IIB|uniref:PTS system mannose/fructose/N-acetylgalactosamine-transporter subunit IIB n=1 Tax=Candidatus Merdisoma sp. JLR.KK011 TaxID=3114299 RepID=UPI001435024E|nr:PTS sugar transporter subunit IIB [Lachnospiraceae bacterium]MCI9252895.1 PTS sugar transporter subunit IIB [Lachnospiraceae bacterium]MCI9478145.1 PTS sugar transporter subunit IIB [Lachnospiraceae bacterium]GFI07701.1 putative phosphotransferase enzyme IIB component [Lachnospiraceae bacterium]
MGKLYVRVDDRLIHGQTIVAWCPTLKIQEIIAVDDASAQNPVLKSILTMGVPKNYVTNVVTTAEANALLEEKSDKNRLVIVKVPEKLGELGDNISDCEQLILGNMAKRPDTVHKISGATGIFYLSEADVKLLDNLAERGMDIVFHQLPNASKVTWKAFKETI